MYSFSKLAIFTTTIISMSLILTACSSKSQTQQISTRHYPSVPAYYTVQRGDTVSKIANRYGLDYRRIGAINGLDSNYTIRVGQRLKLSNTNATNTTNNNSNQRKTTQQTTRPATVNANMANNPNPTSYNSSFVSTKWLVPVNGNVIRGFDEAAGTRGIWYGASQGATVMASQAGTVLYTGSGLPEYGNLIMIQHDNGYLTAYAHLASFSVVEKQRVDAGQKIGSIGYVSLVNQPALEFQIRYKGTPINPINMLK